MWRLDRLGRNLADLVGLVADMENRKSNFESVTEKIETVSPSGRLVFHVFAALAEFERNLIRERTMAGLTAARAGGRTGGRPPKLTPKEVKTIRALLNQPRSPLPRLPHVSISPDQLSIVVWSIMAPTENTVLSHRRSKRIVIATIGSLGDLHPCLALAQELNRRGHRVTIASTPYYRSKVEALGIAFQPIRPDWNPTDPEIISQCEDLKKGPEVLYRNLLLPELRGTYEDLLVAASTADLMIAGELVYAAPLVAEKLAMRWVSAILSPFSFFSSLDPPVMVNAPSLIHLRKGGPSLYRFGLNIGRLATRHWSNPVRRLRRDLGLTLKCDPVFRDKFSPDLVLALFSPLLARQQSDWPLQTLQPGFIHFDDTQRSTNTPSPLAAFLESGTAPIVFTQGSTAVHNPGLFYETSAEAALRVGKRAVLLGMKTPTKTRSPNVMTLPYTAYSQIFPHAAVNVHQGGSGTIGEAMRSGRPMLVVPYGWDQPDNAARIERLGVGLHIARDRYSVTTAATALDRLLNETRYTVRAAEVGHTVGTENALNSACNAIEAVLIRSL